MKTSPSMGTAGEIKETRLSKTNSQLEGLNSRLIDLDVKLTVAMDSLIGCTPEGMAEGNPSCTGSSGVIGRQEVIVGDLIDTGKRLEKTIERISSSGIV